MADEMLRGKEGECMVFDDSFEHEAWHKGDVTRIVLVFDVWHPDLSDKEVQFLAMLQVAARGPVSGSRQQQLRRWRGGVGGRRE